MQREKPDTFHNRIIPVLLLDGKGLVKGRHFKDFKYVGDPMNAVRIFNEKDVDELFFLDITATREERIPMIEMIEQIADECYMPFGVGGGIRTIEHIRDILRSGAEKVSVNSVAVENPQLIRNASEMFGRQSIVVSIDVKRNWRNKYVVYTHSGTKKTKLDTIAWAIKAEELGAGEILLNSIDRDGTGSGYDLDIIKAVSDSVEIPVIACGGAGRYHDLISAIDVGHASAVAAGSLFVFHGKHRAVLISYPKDNEWNDLYIT
jgi:cyclase